MDAVVGEVERDDAGDLKEEAGDNDESIGAQVDAKVLVGGGLEESR